MSEFAEPAERISRTATLEMEVGSGFASLVGVWLVVTPFEFGATGVVLWSNVIVGLGMTLLGGYNYTRILAGKPSQIVAMVVVLLLGAWTMLVPTAVGGTGGTLVLSNGIAGGLAVVFAGYVVYRDRSSTRAQ